MQERTVFSEADLVRGGGEGEGGVVKGIFRSFPTSANLSMHSSLDLAQTGKPCNFLQNFAKAVHED